jgi:hypothetical protein
MYYIPAHEDYSLDRRYGHRRAQQRDRSRGGGHPRRHPPRHHYAKLAAALGDAYTVHAIDRRGRGPSGRQGPDYSIDREVEDAIAVLDATGSAVVFGHSYGGLVALERIIPNATLIMSPRLEHNAPDLNAPEAVAGLVRTFLTPAESMP